MSFVSNAVSLLATSAIVAPLGLLTSVVLARLLGAENLGFYAILATFVNLSVLLMMFGWPSAVIYRIRRMQIDPGVVASTGLLAMTAVSILFVLVGWSVEEWVAQNVLGGVPIPAYRVALFLVPAQLYGRLLVALARALDRFDIANRYVIWVAGSTCVGMFVVLSFGEPALLKAMVALLGVHCGASVGLGVAILRKSGFSVRISNPEIFETVQYGFKSYVQSIAGQLHEQVDVLMLAIFAIDPAQIAAYAIAVGVANRLKIVPEAISGALFPHVAALEPERASEVAEAAARHSVLWAWLTAIGVAVVTPMAVPLIFGEQYAGAVLPILVLLPGAAMLTTYMVLARYFMGIDRQGVIVRSQLISLCLNIGMNALLIPQIGIVGAAIASLMSYGLEMCLMVSAFSGTTGRPAKQVFLLTRVDLNSYLDRIREFRTGSK